MDRDLNDYLKIRRNIGAFFHLLMIFIELVIPLYLHGIIHIFYYFLQLSTLSLGLTLLFMLSHNFEGVGITEGKHMKNDKGIDWYKDQIEHSCTYGGFISGLLTGGLNFQIEHHCFPRINSIHYPKMQALVQSICDKHGIKYVYYPTLIENVISTIKQLMITGQNKSDKKLD